MGAKGTPLTADEHAEIARLLEEGKSRAQIAKTTGRSVGSIDRVAKAIGWSADQSIASRTRNAQLARSAFCAERRAALAARLQEEAERLVDELHVPYLAFNFGGKDNTYEEHRMDEPPVEAKRQIIQMVEAMTRTIVAIDKHDNEASGDVGARGLLERLMDSLESVAA